MVCGIEISLGEKLQHAANLPAMVPVTLEASLHIDQHFHLHLLRNLKSAHQELFLQISIIHLFLGPAFRVLRSVDSFKQVALGQGGVLAILGTLTSRTSAALGHGVIGYFTKGKYPPAVGREVVRSGESSRLLHSLFYCRLIFITLESYPSMYCVIGMRLILWKCCPLCIVTISVEYGQ